MLLLLKAHDNSNYDPGGTQIRATIEEMRRSLGKPGRPPIEVISHVLSREEMPRLYAAADCFVLPTRGEGWNLCALEAMATGLPVICTRWSAHLDFLNDQNSYLVDIEGTEPIPPGGRGSNPAYRGSCWARPSLQHLRHLLRHLYHNQQEGREKGASMVAKGRQISFIFYQQNKVPAGFDHPHPFPDGAFGIPHLQEAVDGGHVVEAFVGERKPPPASDDVRAGAGVAVQADGAGVDLVEAATHVQPPVSPAILDDRDHLAVQVVLAVIPRVGLQRASPPRPR